MSRRRLPALVLVLVALVAGLGAATPTPAAASSATLAEGERHLFALLNRSRASAGLVGLRVDARLTRIARSRSADMAARRYLAHTTPEGRDVFDMIESADIRWYAAGENLGANTYPTLTDSAAIVNHQWLESSTHRAVLLGRYNYVGIGLAISDTGRKVWTAVFLKGPDRSRPWTESGRVSRPTATTVRFTWTGGDVRLAVLTAGLRDFQVQRRRGSGAWVTVTTTALGRTFSVARGETYAFRVRARDRVGNLGLWSQTVTITT